MPRQKSVHLQRWGPMVICLLLLTAPPTTVTQVTPETTKTAEVPTTTKINISTTIKIVDTPTMGAESTSTLKESTTMGKVLTTMNETPTTTNVSTTMTTGNTTTMGAESTSTLKEQSKSTVNESTTTGKESSTMNETPTTTNVSITMNTGNTTTKGAESTSTLNEQSNSTVNESTTTSKESTTTVKDTTTINQEVQILPPRNILGSNVLASSVDLSWTAPQTNDTVTIKSYILTYSTADGVSQTVNTGTSSSQYQLTGLKACNSYNIIFQTVALINGNTVMSSYSNALSVTTSATAPSLIDSATLTQLNSGSVKLDIVDKSSREICGTYLYYVTITVSGTTRVQSSKIDALKTITLDGLKAGEKYIYEVYVQEKKSRQMSTAYKGAEFTMDAKASPCKDQSKMDFKASNVTQNSITLIWAAPVMVESSPTPSYSLQYVGDTIASTTVNLTTYTASDLTSCTKYTFTLIPKSGDVFCEALKPLIVTTYPKDPVPVASVTPTAVNSNQIDLVIVPAMNSDPCATVVFQVTLAIDGKEVSKFKTSQTTYSILTGLTPSTLYTISVSTVYLETKAFSSAKTTTATTPAANSGRPLAPNNVSVTAIGANSLSITWTPRSETGVTGYSIYYESVKGIENLVVSSSSASKATVMKLAPCTEYSVWMYTMATVSGANLVSDGSTPKVNITTGHPTPSTPQSIVLSQINETAVNLVVNDQNLVQCGTLSYSVELFQVDSKTQRVSKNSIMPGALSTAVQIGGLRTGRNFFGLVAAFNSEAKLQGSAVRSPLLYLSPSSPVPTASTLSDLKMEQTMATLSWTAASIDKSASISAYQMVATDPRGFSVTVTVAGTLLTGTVSPLFPCTTYSFSVIALSNAVVPIPGPPSILVSKTTLVTKSEVKTVVLKQASNTSASVFIDAKLPACSSSYILKLKSVARGIIWTRTFVQRPNLIEGLEIGSTYTLVVAIRVDSNVNIISNEVESNSLTITGSPPVVLPESEVSMQAPLTGLDSSLFEYNPAFSDPASPEYLSKASELCKAMSVFVQNSGQSVFISKCEVRSFTPGSVIADLKMSVQSYSGAVVKDVGSIISSGISQTPTDQVSLSLDPTAIITAIVAGKSNDGYNSRRNQFSSCAQLIFLWILGRAFF